MVNLIPCWTCPEILLIVLLYCFSGRWGVYSTHTKRTQFTAQSANLDNEAIDSVSTPYSPPHVPEPPSYQPQSISLVIEEGIGEVIQRLDKIRRLEPSSNVQFNQIKVTELVILPASESTGGKNLADFNTIRILAEVPHGHGSVEMKAVNLRGHLWKYADRSLEQPENRITYHRPIDGAAAFLKYVSFERAMEYFQSQIFPVLKSYNANLQPFLKYVKLERSQQPVSRFSPQLISQTYWLFAAKSTSQYYRYKIAVKSNSRNSAQLDWIMVLRPMLPQSQGIYPYSMQPPYGFHSPPRL